MTTETSTDTNPNLVFIGETVAFCVIIGLVFLSYGLYFIDTVGQQKSHVREIVYILYRETAILGFVAFIVFIIERSTSSSITSSTLNQLENIHVAVWVILLVHIFWIITLLFFSYRIGNAWARIEEEYGNNFLAYKRVREHLALLSDQLQITRLYATTVNTVRNSRSSLVWNTLYFYSILGKGMCTHPILFTRYLQVLHITRYLEQRYRFIRRNDLPYNFRFFSYLVECKQHVLVKLIRIPIGLWLFLTLLLSMDTYLRSVWLWWRNNYDSTAIIVTLCIVGIAVSLLIWIKIRIIYWKIFHSEFATLQVSHEVVQKAVDWAAILPAGTGFGMSMRIHPSDLSLPPILSSVSQRQQPILRLPSSTSQLIQRGSSLVVRAQEIEEELLRRQAYLREPPIVSSVYFINPPGWDTIPPTSPDVDAPVSLHDTRGIPEFHTVTKTKKNKKKNKNYHATVLSESKYPDIPITALQPPITLNTTPVPETETEILEEEGGPDEEPSVTERTIPGSTVSLDHQQSYQQYVRGEEQYQQHLRAQKRLFWFQQPLFLLRLVQLVPFVYAIAIAILALFFRTIISSTKDFILSFVFIGVGIIFCVFILRDVISLYILAIHVSDLVDTRLLAYSVLKHEQYHRQRYPEQEKLKQNTEPKDHPLGDTDSKDPSALSLSLIRLLYRIRYYISLPLIQNSICILLSLVNIFLLAISSSDWIQIPYRRGIFITVLVLTCILVFEYSVRIGVWSLTYWIYRHLRGGVTNDNKDTLASVPHPSTSSSSPSTGIYKYSTFPVRSMYTMIILDTIGMGALIVGTIIGIVYGSFSTNPSNSVDNKGAPMYLVGYFLLRMVRLMLVDNHSQFQREVIRLSPYGDVTDVSRSLFRTTSPRPRRSPPSSPPNHHHRRHYSSFIASRKDYPIEREESLTSKITPHLLIQSPSSSSPGRDNLLRLRRIPMVGTNEPESLGLPVRSVSFSGASAFTTGYGISPTNYPNDIIYQQSSYPSLTSASVHSVSGPLSPGFLPHG